MGNNPMVGATVACAVENSEITRIIEIPADHAVCRDFLFSGEKHSNRFRHAHRTKADRSQK